MKIQKRFLRKYKDKDYYKYIVNIPPMVLKEAGIKMPLAIAEISLEEVYKTIN